MRTDITDITRIKECMEDYLRQRGLPVKKPFRCLSPAHEDRHPSMSYNPYAKNVHCFACGATYDVFDLIGMDYGLGGFPERLEKACAIFGFEQPGREGTVYYSAPGLSYAVEPEKPGPPQIDCGGELERLRQSADSDTGYLEARGITRESIEKYGFFQLKGRAFFPIIEDGICAGWCARSVDGGAQPRYLNSKGQIGIWNGGYLSKNGGGKRLFITEGIIDAVCLEQMGERAIALCGSQNTQKLIDRCEKNIAEAKGWRFVLCGDPDEAGKKMNEALGAGLGKLGLDCEALGLPFSGGDINSLYLRDREALAGLLRVAEKPSPDAVYAGTCAASGIDEFFAEARRRGGRDAIPTGFKSLDKLLDGGLRQGLYVLGAISSVGKTSFALQMADYIAENTADVLFFSLEQSRFELMAKSMSRISAGLDGGRKANAFTARQLLSGQEITGPGRQRLLEGTKEIYAKTASGLFIREGEADIGAAGIREAVDGHIKRRGRAPVVIVDYLQILSPADLRATDKQNTDRAVVELKRVSRDFDIPVIAISSFNRENYRAAVSMEAFKESGAVEYSSDVLLGIQLYGAGEKGFDANAEKLKEPRRIELVMLKNRSGIPYAKIELRYTAKFSLFEEAGNRE